MDNRIRLGFGYELAESVNFLLTFIYKIIKVKKDMAKKRYDAYGRMKKRSFYRKKMQERLLNLYILGNSKDKSLFEYKNTDAIFEPGYFPEYFGTLIPPNSGELERDVSRGK